MSNPVSFQDQQDIVDLFVNKTKSINHIVFLYGYFYDVDDVGDIIRDRIKQLETNLKSYEG